MSKRTKLILKSALKVFEENQGMFYDKLIKFKAKIFYEYFILENNSILCQQGQEPDPVLCNEVQFHNPGT